MSLLEFGREVAIRIQSKHTFNHLDDDCVFRYDVYDSLVKEYSTNFQSKSCRKLLKKFIFCIFVCKTMIYMLQFALVNDNVSMCIIIILCIITTWALVTC